MVRVNRDNTSGFVTISFDHQSPNVARDVILALINQVNRALSDIEVEEAERSIDFLQSQLQETSIVSLEQMFASLIE